VNKHSPKKKSFQEYSPTNKPQHNESHAADADAPQPSKKAADTQVKADNKQDSPQSECNVL
jgi:hypothetical protein